MPIISQQLKEKLRNSKVGTTIQLSKYQTIRVMEARSFTSRCCNNCVLNDECEQIRMVKENGNYCFAHKRPDRKPVYFKLIQLKS